MSLVRSSLLRLAKSRASALRSYATEAAPEAGKLRLSLVLPHEIIFKSSDVFQVNLDTDSSGAIGILANHVPSVESLKPGVLEVIEGAGTESKKWFVSGGFANVHPNNSLTINAVEAYPLDAFSLENIRTGLAEAQRVAAGNGDDAEKAEARIEVEVYEALQNALRA